MQDILLVVDMQNDFIDGPLGSGEARAIVGRAAHKMRGFPGRVITTRDTHEKDYLDTQEGQKLPVPHCVRGTPGWQLHPLIEIRQQESRQQLLQRLHHHARSTVIVPNMSPSAAVAP